MSTRNQIDKMDNIKEYRVSSSEQTIAHIKADDGMYVEIAATQSSVGLDTKNIDQRKSSALSTFKSNYECWNDTNIMSSLSNTDNCYFREIVKMGIEAVPFIYKELQKGPTDLVYALDEIFGNPIKYDGFVPLEQSCNIWLSILQKTETV